ncbi:MAG: AprI/Inh family metalloprotease inhibitor [Pseudomonadota bacterium]|nr:AprI/Inh family metalloprotease inhibitor [Pseudomonadota bacterium]
MNQNRPLVAALACTALVVVLAGCNRSVSALDPGAPPAPLPSAPLDPVQAQSLDPVTGQPIDPATGQPLPPGAGTPGQVAALDPNAPGADGQPQSLGAPPAPAGGGAEISRESMTGTWTVASDNPECRIILAFTKWSGGYRAATRRCNTAELGAVTAWDVKGSQVVLVDGTGNTVATLYSAGPERYDGSTSSGKVIQFTR